MSQTSKDTTPSIDQITPDQLLQSVQVLRDRANTLLISILKDNLNTYLLINLTPLQQLLDDLPSQEKIIASSEDELILYKDKIRQVCNILRRLSDLMLDVRNALISIKIFKSLEQLCIDDTNNHAFQLDSSLVSIGEADHLLPSPSTF